MFYALPRLRAPSTRGLRRGVSFTTLRVSARGVVLFEDHATRLGRLYRHAFERFAAHASHGVYALRGLETGELEVEYRSGSKLMQPGLTVKTAVSPVRHHPAPFAKPPSPSEYDAVRSPGAVTLLTDAEGSEIYEACVAAVMAWDGASLVLVPSDRPRVLSVAESFVARNFSHRRAPIRTDGDWGLLLINAAESLAPESAPARCRFDPLTLERVRASIDATAAR